jgi:hypothetical protein
VQLAGSAALTVCHIVQLWFICCAALLLHIHLPSRHMHLQWVTCLAEELKCKAVSLSCLYYFATGFPPNLLGVNLGAILSGSAALCVCAHSAPSSCICRGLE